MVKEKSSNRYHPYERKKYVAGENPLEGKESAIKVDHILSEMTACQ
jgi:hypothetical protein